jgi:hypothetical protein
MTQSALPNPSVSRSSHTYFVGFIFLVMLAIYTWVYYFEPLTPISEYLNDKVGDSLVLIPAVLAAWWGTQLTRQFKPSEPPHRVWLTFSIGWWAWVGGEILGFVYDYFYWTTDYPELTLIDLCWSLGYIFFGLSLYYQFRLIYSWKTGRKSALYLLFIGLALAAAYGLAEWARRAGLGEGYSWFPLYLAILYPVFDVFEGLAALWLFFLFGRGYLGRPWWGLIAFALADSINIYSWMGGFDRTPDNIYNTFDLFSAIMYLAGYMITALAFFSAIRHIRAGLTKIMAAPAPEG